MATLGRRILNPYVENFPMTVAAANITNSYTGNSGANTYPFSFPAINNTDISVTVTSPSGTVYPLVYNQDFNVFGLNPNGSPPTNGYIQLINAGQAWLTAGNLTAGWTITLTRIMVLQQSISIRNQGDFYPETIENALDIIVMLIQQLQAGAISQIYTTGFVVTTPDGTKTYLIGVDNGGNLAATRLT